MRCECFAKERSKMSHCFLFLFSSYFLHFRVTFRMILQNNSESKDDDDEEKSERKVFTAKLFKSNYGKEAEGKRAKECVKCKSSK